jgi:hypothetical protein
MHRAKKKMQTERWAAATSSGDLKIRLDESKHRSSSSFPSLLLARTNCLSNLDKHDAQQKTTEAQFNGTASVSLCGTHQL